MIDAQLWQKLATVKCIKVLSFKELLGIQMLLLLF